jgi:hypothetical protein
MRQRRIGEIRCAALDQKQGQNPREICGYREFEKCIDAPFQPLKYGPLDPGPRLVNPPESLSALTRETYAGVILLKSREELPV